MDDMRVWTIDEIMAEESGTEPSEDIKLQDDEIPLRQFGNWFLSLVDDTYFISHIYFPWYYITLSNIKTSAQLLDWIIQVSHKGHYTDEDIGQFVRALDDIYEGIQGKFCPWGESQEVDSNSHLSYWLKFKKEEE